MRKNKIVHVITGLNQGGAEKTLYRLVTNSTHHQHIIISLLDKGYYGDLLEKNGIKVVTINMNRGVFSIQSFFKLYKTIKEINPNIVQTWMYHADLLGGIASKLAGVKGIFWGVRHSDINSSNTSKKTQLIIRLLAKLSNYIPTKIIYCAKFSANIHESLGYSKQKTVLIQNGIESSTIKNKKIKNDIVFFAMIARYHSIKNHALLLNSLSIIKSKGYAFKCFLAGSDIVADNSTLVSMIRDLRIEDNIVLTGQQENIYDFLKEIDFHILSSDSEAFPNVLAEAMITGVPCISTNVGDASLIINNLGWISEPKDITGLSANIENALEMYNNNYNEYLKISEKCINHTKENFSIETMVNKYYHSWKI